jgi:predicted dehydrogenase
MRVGIVGCGHIGRMHLSYLLKTPRVSVVAVCDQDQSRAEQFAHEFRVPGFYGSLDSLLGTDPPEVVHVLTPPSTHASLAIQALEAGCHVLVEKPFTLSVADADRVIAAASRAGRKVCVDHNHLFDPPVLEAIGYLESGVLGELLSLNCFQGVSLPNGVNPTSVRAWFQNLPLGPIHDVVPHTLAFLLRFVGIPRWTNASVRKEGPVCTEVKILAEGRRASASCTLSLTARPFMHTLELFGSEASIEIDVERMMLSVKRDRKLPMALRKAMPPLEESARLALSTVGNTVRYVTGNLRRFPGIGELIRRFYRSLETGEDSPVSVEDAREVVRLTDILVQRSKGNGLCVSL